MDLRTELLLSREEMLATVKKGPWKRAVETLLSSKKQFLEDTTNKQVLNKASYRSVSGLTGTGSSR